MRTVTLGFLANIYDDPFANSPTSGFFELTRNLNARIIMFPFPSQRNSIAEQDKQNLILKVIDGQSVDGLIISGFFSHGVSETVFREFCLGFAPLPVVTLGAKVDGVPAVVTETAKGFDALMDHLTLEHRYTRLAFLGGPPGQREAEERKGCFLQGLARRGLTPQERWMAYGDFSYESGRVAMRQLLAQGRPEFEGIVCANDSMALAARAELTDVGLRVPDDLFLTGFDDYHAENLSTVRQSSFEQLRAAVNLLLRVLRDGAPPSDARVESELVIRSSCRCGVHDRHRRSLAALPHDESWPRLLEAWQSTLTGGNAEAFSNVVQSLLEDPLVSDPEERWRGLEWRLKASSHEPRAQELLDLARFQVWEISQARRVQRLHRLSQQSIQLREFSEAINNSPTIDDSLEVIARGLPGLGVKGCWVSLLDDPDGNLAWSTLRVAFDHTGRWQLPPAGIRFPSSELRPGGCHDLGEDHWMLFAEVLQSKDQVFGLVLFSVTLEASLLCEALRLQISVSLQGARLWEERKRQEQRLVESEKMAALGSLVAGVAHEINTPLGIGITASSDLRQRIALVREKLNRQELRRGELLTCLNEVAEEGQIIEENLTRAGDLVQSFKQIAVDQSYEEARLFSVAEYLHHIVLSLKARLKSGGHRCEVSCVQGTMLEGPPGSLVQIFTNLIENSLMHGFAGRRGGHIHIAAEPHDQEVWFVYEDDGHGIPPEHLGKIFEPFFTTKRGQGGSGLGLAIVYNLVVQAWGGSVHCESRAEQGARFVITLPLVSRQRPPTA